MAEANEVAQRVERALATDTRIDHSKIQVRVTSDGVVTLTGQVKTFSEKITAEEITARVTGVVDIKNEIGVLPEIPRSDEKITAEIREALERDVWVDDTKIGIETVNGVVFLRGTVAALHEREEAENVARWAAGVIDVVNHINVEPRMKLADEEIARDVRAALLKNTRLDLTEMGVIAKDGVVHLTGTVRNYTQKKIAEYIAFGVPGVVDVVNDLSVKLERAA
jgi:osmotically-inducible protein OsmY